MFTFIGAKGGVGTTSFAVIAASGLARRGHDVLLVDLTGDVAMLLGMRDDHPGVSDWTSASELSLGALEALSVDAIDHVALLPRGTGNIDADRLQTAWSLLAGRPYEVIIDAGTGKQGMDLVRNEALRRVLVVTTCFQAMRRARQVVHDATDVMAVTDRDRVFTVGEVEAALGRAATVCVERDPAIARWQDSGWLLDRGVRVSQFLDELR